MMVYKRNYPLLIATILFGVIFALVGEVFYDKYIEKIYTPLFIALYFFSFALIIVAVIYFFSLNKNIKYSRQPIRDTIISLICVFIFSFVFEFIYEIGNDNIYKEPNSYIFVIDDSGSMKQNDSQNERIKAIQSVLQDRPMDFNYSVYVFNDNCIMHREMKPKKLGLGTIELKSSGGTGISGAIKTVTKDILSGVITNIDSSKIILISDGYSSDSFFGVWSVNKELKILRKNGVSISTVGIGNSVDSDFMKKIASKTGGVYISVDQVSELGNAMSKAALSYSKRDLLSIRTSQNYDWIYALMRIIFLFLIGYVFIFVKGFSAGDFDGKLMYILCSVLSLIAALVVEIGMNYLFINVKVAHIILCICFALFLNKYLARISVYSETDDYTYRDNKTDSLKTNKDKMPEKVGLK